MFKSKLLQKTNIYNHGLPPLLMQNPYSKFILAIKTLIFDRFSKLLQALLRQIETQMLNKKYFSCPQQLKILTKKSLSEGSFYTIIHYFMINKFSKITILYAAFVQSSSHVSGEHVGTICYIRSLKSQHQTLTFLERTKMIRLYRKIAILLILKTSLSLKMSYVPILNDMIIMTIPHYYLICYV